MYRYQKNHFIRRIYHLYLPWHNHITECSIHVWRFIGLFCCEPLADRIYVYFVICSLHSRINSPLYDDLCSTMNFFYFNIYFNMYLIYMSLKSEYDSHANITKQHKLIHLTDNIKWLIWSINRNTKIRVQYQCVFTKR